MTIKSMTGFGEARGETGGYAVHVEVRSVNQRGRDVRVLTQPRALRWEHEVAKCAAQHVERGKVDVRVTLEPVAAAVAQARAAEWHRERGERRRLRLWFGAAALPTLGSGARAMAVEAQDVDTDQILSVAAAALQALDAARRSEGTALQAVLTGQLDAIAAHGQALRARAAADAALREAGLRERLAALGERGLGLADAERLRGEVALLLVRDDICEELDRLTAHVAAARALIAEGTAVGRRLDVLAQELGREAHTASSKAATAETKAIALELRHVVEQLREQVQNIE